MTTIDAHHARIMQRFVEWQHCRTRLQEHSQQVDGAMRDFVAGSVQLPPDLTERLHALRKECDALFVLVLEAMSERAADREKKA